MNPHPVIGPIHLDMVNILLGTGFGKFSTGTIEGLARVEHPQRIDILAVVAKSPGNGHFRRFLRDLMGAYQIVVFWHVVNETLALALTRRGFTLGTEGIYTWNNPCKPSNSPSDALTAQ